YDKKNKKLLKVDDVLRLDYVSTLTSVAKNNNISVKEEVSSFENFMLGKDKVVFYFNGYKDQIDFKYADYKRYIKLQNVNIPSLAPTTPLSVKERKIDPKKPMIALTYDDGPSGAFTTAMLDVLAKENVSATFFTLGSRVKEYPELIKREYMDGHQIASHGYDHADLRSLDMNATKKQMFDTSDAIFSLTGYDPSYVRPPFGAESDNLHSLYDEDHIILWTIDTRDWATRNAEAIKNVVLENVTDGSIILMHDMYQPSIDATEQLIPLLKEKGYQMVTVDELIKYKYKK
ncbi:MAG: polysaccharide deacetylase family protein, partial [Erysipelotrichaceae bacterium]